MFICFLFFIILFIRVCLRTLEFVAIILEEKAKLTKDQTDDQLVLFFRDFFKVILYIIGFLLILHYVFNENIGNLVTSLSLVGAAVALSMRESLENIIASFIIFFDKPFTVGDIVKVNSFTGTIEKIGLRSTRIRTLEKTFISVPNKQMVDSIVDNISLRTERKIEMDLQLSVQTSADALAAFSGHMKKIISTAPFVMNGSVFLSDAGKQFHNIHIECLVSLDVNINSFQELREHLNIEAVQYATTHQIIFAKKAIEIQDQVLLLFAENKKILDVQLQNGNAIKLDVLTIQSKIDNEINKKIDLETNLKKLLNLLHYATGLTSIKEGTLKLALKNYNLEEAIQLAILNNPSLAIAKDKVNVSKSDVSITKLNERPFVGMKASVGGRNGYLPKINDPRFNYNAGIGFSVPLFNGGKIKQQIKIQEQGVALNETMVTSILHDFEKDIQAALIDINSSESRINNAASQIEQAGLAQKLSVSKLKNGTATPIEITTANTDYQKALLNQLQYQYQLCNAQLELARLIGLELID